MAKLKFKKSQIEKALKDSRGFLAFAARRLGCDRTTIENYLERYPELKIVREKLTEDNLDIGEYMLMENVLAGKESSIAFLLKTLGRKRDYGERSEIDLNAKVVIVVGLPEELSK
jgi:hypothetical protein